VESRVERRTGIEGWFDEPQHRDIRDLRVQPPPPPRWKQALVIFLVFYPLSTAVNWLSGATSLGELPLLLRVLVSVLLMTPVMTYAALPWITRKMQWFLQGQPPPWRRQRG
jgi:antibiotic biosynthesis monooxygenase (ABM) superfamily enzyme